MQNGNFKSRSAETASPKQMAGTGTQPSPACKNYEAGLGSTPTGVAATGVVAGTATPAEVAGTGTACRE
jgi:hypothetical protein